MSAPTNMERVQQMYAAFGRGDVPAILNALAPDATWTVQGPAQAVA
jgi:ketosteroid isomerase-like protein